MNILNITAVGNLPLAILIGFGATFIAVALVFALIALTEEFTKKKSPDEIARTFLDN